MTDRADIAYETSADGAVTCVPTVEFDYGIVDAGLAGGVAEDLDKARIETALRLLQFLTADGISYKESGRRALMWQHILRPTGTQRALAARMGQKESLVSMKLKFWRAELFNGSNGISLFGEEKILSDPHL